jgi:hypothetical protein
MFDDAELRAFLYRLHDGDRLAASLPGSTASLHHVVFELIGLLRRHGVIDRDLFEALSEARPRRRSDIVEVASAWGVSMGAQAPASTPDARASVVPGPVAKAAPSAEVATSSPASSPARWDVFISFSSEDRDWVRVLAENLDQLGLEVFFDEWEVGYGEVVTHRLDEGLRGSRNGVLVISPSAVSRPWVLEEYAALLTGAVHRGVKLIPVLYRTAELPAMLGNRRWVDLREKTGDEYLATVRELAAALRGERPARPPRGQGLRAPGAPVGDGSAGAATSRPHAGAPSWDEYVPPQASDRTFPVSRLETMWGPLARDADARGLQLTGRPYKGNDHAYASATEGLRQVQVRALRAPSASPVVADGRDGPSVEVSFAGTAVPRLGGSSGTQGRLRYIAGTTRGSSGRQGEVRLRVVVLLDGWEALADDAGRGELLAEAFRAAAAVFERLTGLSLGG